MGTTVCVVRTCTYVRVGVGRCAHVGWVGRCACVWVGVGMCYWGVQVCVDVHERRQQHHYSHR